MVPGVQVVQAVDFVSDDPDCSGTMTMTWELSRAEAGTRIEIRAEDVPDLTPDSRGPQATLSAWRTWTSSSRPSPSAVFGTAATTATPS
jgi:hypothetical protein